MHHDGHLHLVSKETHRGKLLFFCGGVYIDKHCAIFHIKKCPRIRYHTLLAKINALFRKKYQICINHNGIWAVLRIPKHDTPLDFSRYRENRLTFLNGIFCDLFQIFMIKYDPAGVTWPWPWVPGEANDFMVRFFWAWVYSWIMLINNERSLG